MLKHDTMDFLHDLRHNNSKEWFDQNRKRYLNVKVDYLSLAGTLLEAMKKEDSTLEMLTAKDCIFRINRDIRFSPDKSPYKTNLGIVLSPGGKKSGLAAYYLHIEEGRSFVGGGLWMPEAPQLNKVRKEIHYFYTDLLHVIQNKEFSKTFGDLDIDTGHKLSRPPKGYDAADPGIEYLKLKSFTASAAVKDAWITSDRLLPFVINAFVAIKPLLQFINRGLMSDADGGL